MTADDRNISRQYVTHSMLYFCPILHHDLKKIERKWNDQCHYFKRMIVKTDFSFTKLQDNKLGTYTRKSKLLRNMLMAAVFTYLSTTCFPLRAIDRSSNVQNRNCSYFPYNRNCPVISAPLLWELEQSKGKSRSKTKREIDKYYK